MTTTRIQTNPVLLAVEQLGMQVKMGGTPNGVFAGTITDPDATGEVEIVWRSLTTTQQETLIDAAGDQGVLISAADLICGGSGSGPPYKRWRGMAGRYGAAVCLDGGYAFVMVLGLRGEGLEP